MPALCRPPAIDRGSEGCLDLSERHGHVHRPAVAAVQHPDLHQAAAGTTVPPLVAVVGQHSVETPDSLTLPDDLAGAGGPQSRHTGTAAATQSIARPC